MERPTADAVRMRTVGNEPDEFDRAKAVVGGFIGNAQRFMADRMERTLYRIAKMNWWQRLWYAGDLAEKTVGIGKYWDADMKDDGV